MRITWELHEKCMRITRELHENYTWELHENYMRITWELHENYMRITWKLHENYMRITWELHENCMKITWELHENYTWELHENYMRITEFQVHRTKTLFLVLFHSVALFHIVALFHWGGGHFAHAHFGKIWVGNGKKFVIIFQWLFKICAYTSHFLPNAHYVHAHFMIIGQNGQEIFNFFFN